MRHRRYPDHISSLLSLLNNFCSAILAAADSLIVSVLTAGFLSPRQIALLILLGGGAGLLGAIASLRRERL